MQTPSNTPSAPATPGVHTPQQHQQSSSSSSSEGRLLRRGERRLTRIALAIVWLFIFCHIWKVSGKIWFTLKSIIVKVTKNTTCAN